MRATTKLLPLLGLAAVLLPVTPASAATTDAAIADFSFSPNPVTIAVGSSVKWTNTDNAGHTVTADNGSFGSGTLGHHGTFTWTFDQPGPVAYHCAIHPSMRGTVQVQGATTTTAAPTTTTTAAPTTTTAAPTTTTTAAGNAGSGATSPTTAGSASPKAASPKPAVSSTTRATAAPTTATAAPVTTTAAPPSSTAPPPAAATEETTATTQAALDMASDEGGSNGVGAIAVLAVLLLVVGGGGGWFALRRRSAGTGV